jgi:hypothetical protein
MVYPISREQYGSLKQLGQDEGPDTVYGFSGFGTAGLFIFSAETRTQPQEQPTTTQPGGVCDATEQPRTAHLRDTAFATGFR